MIKTRKKTLATDGLPVSVETERLVLGAIILQGSECPLVAQVLEPDDFSLESHRRVFAAMVDLQMREEVIDRVTLANELVRREQLDSVGGLSYLTSLDVGLPASVNLESYIAIIKEKSRLRKIIRAASSTNKAAMASDAVSEEIIQQSQQDLLRLSSNLENRGRLVSDYIADFPGGLNLMLDPSKREQGVRTGFRILDEWTDGFHPSEIFLIGARPGVGKSSIGLNISRYIAKRSGLVVFFSLEMPMRTCIDRLICDVAEVSFQKFRNGTLEEEDRKQLQPALAEVNKLPIFIDDGSGLTIPEISMRLQALSNERPVTLCVIDYVQLLRTPRGQRYSTLNEKFEQITEDLQGMVKRNKIPLLLLSQLNRESTKGKETRPQLSQVRNSGTFEQIANVGAVISRPGVGMPSRGDLKKECSLIVEKNRSGPSGDIELRYLASIMRFEDVSEG